MKEKTEAKATEKLFYSDSYRKKFTASVLSCEERGGIWFAELDRTAFFPEGGGQYADTGLLSGAEVFDVQEEDGRIFHKMRQPLLPGKEVEGEIDWDPRFMKMQQHTGEHIVSGIVHSWFGYDNVGFHLGTMDCTMDFNGALTQTDLDRVEREANEAVWKNLPVIEHYPTKEEEQRMEFRSKIEIAGQVRVIEVPGYDWCACCAPHVSRTGEIGLIKLTGLQRYKGGVRVTMLCGVRALEDYRVKQEQAKAVSSLLCTKENETAEGVRHLKEECASLKYEVAEREKRLAKYKADAIPEECRAVCIFTDEFQGESLRTLMNCVLERERLLCAVFSGSDETGYRYVIGSRREDMRPLAKEMNERFQGRGGGKPEMVQGTIQGPGKEIEAWILTKAGRME